MKRIKRVEAIIIGDSTNNTLSAVRSLGEVGIPMALILKCQQDIHYVSHSKYLDKNHVYVIPSIEECLPVLKQYQTVGDKKIPIICTFDEAAVFVDQNETCLSKYFLTPTRGKQLGELFNKDAQCRLAQQCGLTVPRSQLFSRDSSFDKIEIDYPILLKPLNSTKGEKSDIHICKSQDELRIALSAESHCDHFILQEFIDKEYEIDCIGVRTEKEVYLAGGIRKIRHFPPLVGAGAYGLFQSMRCYDIDISGVEKFILAANYYGPFSIELLHKGDKNYFMEVNFRNEGLAYAATAAGANLHALYINPSLRINRDKIRSVYMMNYSLDFLYVKDGSVSLWSWLRDFLRTRCFININMKDLNPTICYYVDKLKSRLKK